MSILEIPFYTELDDKLSEMWRTTKATSEEWVDFIKELDKNIILVEDNEQLVTTITFSKPEHITWFLMRWS